MDDNFIRQAKGRLLEEKQNLVVQLEKMTKEKSFDKDKVQAKWQELGNKEEDNAVEVADWQDNIAIERDLEINLERIEKALDRIDQGKYGQCEKCSQSIEDERLSAYPEATVCMKCANEKKV